MDDGTARILAVGIQSLVTAIATVVIAWMQRRTQQSLQTNTRLTRSTRRLVNGQREAMAAEIEALKAALAEAQKPKDDAGK